LRRLLVIADSKMLPALTSGLREGGRFDVTAMPLSDVAAVQTAADGADAVALFYGAPGAPLPAALQALAPRVRQRGGRLVAVLQREQAAQRDECFRAGASDLLFMPMPKDQFVRRLEGSLGLSWNCQEGSPSPVAVATRNAASRVDEAKVCPDGIEAASELPLKAGDTVRLSWGAFQSWGLVVRGSPSAQIRFAGLVPDEEVKIRDWLKSALPAAGAAPGNRAVLAPSRRLATATPPAGSPPVMAAQRMAPSAQVAEEPATEPAAANGVPAVRSAPAAGPPPGFADRHAARESRPRVTPLGSARVATNGIQPVDGEESPLAAVLEAEPAPEPAPAPGTPWPTPIAAADARAAGMQVVAGEPVDAAIPAHVAASAKKIAGMLSAGERVSLEGKGPDSHFADAFAARIALDAAAAEALRLSASGQGVLVDAAASASITRIADEAAARLQKEANAAVAQGEVERLQLITAASAALSRDLLNFKETADRLRGVGAAPRLGAGALDPEVVLPGQQPRPRPPPGAQAPAPPKPELRDFHGIDDAPRRGKKLLAGIAVTAFVVVAANALYFGMPRVRQVDPQEAGTAVERVQTSGESAVVMVKPEWAAQAVGPLLTVLRERGVKRALLVLKDGRMVGTLDVASGKLVLNRPAAPR
jgi:CheY-like chemotaxis protein